MTVFEGIVESLLEAIEIEHGNKELIEVRGDFPAKTYVAKSKKEANGDDRHPCPLTVVKS